MTVVLDASAALAWLKDEPGSDVVEPLLPDGVVSAINWSEVLQKARYHGRDPQDTGELFEAFGISVATATRGDAVLASRFWSDDTPLSLADRFCLALAYRLGVRAITAERTWADLDTGVEVVVIR